MKRSETLAFFAKHRREEIVVATMSAYLEWPAYSSHPLDYVDGDAMGEATPVGLGLALAQPEKQVWVFHGDGAQLMALGSLVTVAGRRFSPSLNVLVRLARQYPWPGGF